MASIQGHMLEHAKYYIKTGLGISDKYYSHSDDARIDGTGQGSGRSPALWGFNSSIYFHLQSKLSHGATYHSAKRQTSSKVHMTVFVDDNNLQTNKDAFHHEPDTSGLVSQMNLDGQVWHDTLWSSGGALSLGKCQNHLMHWLFLASGAPVLHGGKFGNPICIRNADGTKATIKQLPVRQSYKTLGAHVNPCNTKRPTTKPSLPSPNFTPASSLAAPARLLTPGSIITPSFFVALATPYPSATSPPINSTNYSNQSS
jgi:hypothetical protein